MAEISKFIIGLMVFSFIVTVFAVGYANISTTYNVTYVDNSSIEQMNKFNDLANQTQELQAQTFGIKSQDSEGADISGSLFSGSISVLLLSTKSYDVFTSMTQLGLSQLPLGPLTAPLIALVLAVVLVMIIFIIVSIMLKGKL